MAEVYIYDEIGPDWMGFVSATAVRAQLDKHKSEPIDLHINSPGGDVFDGLAIYNMLVEHKPGVTVHIDGLAASAASFIAMAGRTIEIAESAMMMVHNAMAFTFGNKEQHEKQIELLAKVDDTLRGIYTARTQSSAEEVAAWLDAETWMTAGEAVERGFADEIGTRNAIKPAAIKAGRYRNTPKAFTARELPREHDRRVREQQAAIALRLTKARIGR